MKTQAELKKMYEEILRREIWGKDEHMIKHCLKETGYIIELENGNIIILEKPSIKKYFCFGYRLNRQDTEEYDEANKMVYHAAKSEEFFKNENLKELNKQIEDLTETPHRFTLCIRKTKYYSQPENSKLKDFAYVESWKFNDESEKSELKEYEVMSEENRRRLIAGYEEVKKAFEKRLNTYLKKYGTRKLKT